jgi:hypothetical protein
METARLYHQVQQHQVLRGHPRRGTMAACLLRVCLINGVSRKPKEISKLFELEQTEISRGDKILDTLHSRGLITHASYHGQGELNCSVPKNQEIAEHDLSRCFGLLDMRMRCERVGENPDRIREFCSQLIRFTIKYGISQGAQPFTRAVGSIRFVALHRPDLELVNYPLDSVCVISKSTYTRFVRNLNDYIANQSPGHTKLMHLYHKYGIIKRDAPYTPEACAE